MAELVILVNGLPGSGKTSLATALAAELAVPLISKDAVKESVAAAVPGISPQVVGPAAAEMMWALAGGVAGDVVLESWWFRPRDLAFVEAGLRRTGATGTVEIWCDVPPGVARERFAARRRDPVHQDDRRLAESWPAWAREGGPLGVGRILTVRTDRPIDIAGLVLRVESVAK